MTKKTLLLVDGSSYLYRAYHALPDLRNAQGEPTGAIYGVISMMRRMASDYQADWLACVFDARGGTFRDDLYPEYKAHRPSMPEDLAAQIEPIHAAVRALGWPVLAVEGVEADDVIGTLTRQATELGVHSVVSTGDKDLAQLVNAHVTLVNTMTNETLDEAGVLARFGVPPSRIVDYLMLVGDTVDNVPGVTKVGPKTAAKWLGQYGSIEGLVAAADTIKGVAGENLRTAIPLFDLTRQLLTVKLDCNLTPVLPDFDALRPLPRDEQALVQVYERYGFRTWLREATGDGARIPQGDGRVYANTDESGAAAAPVAATVDTEYETVTDRAALDRWLARIASAELVALDTETDSLDPMTTRLVGISLGVAPGQACYIPLAHRARDVPEQSEAAAAKGAKTAKSKAAKAAAALAAAGQGSLYAADEPVPPADAADDTAPATQAASALAAPDTDSTATADTPPAATLQPHDQLPMDEVLAALKPWLEDPKAAKLLHHAKFDAHVFANAGIALAGIAHDTMLQAYVLESHRTVGMQDLAQRWLGVTGTTYEQLCGKGASAITFDQVPIDQASHYACEDADFTLRLHQVLYPRLQAEPRLCDIYALELDVSRTLLAIERNGVRIDAVALASQSLALGEQMLTLEQRAYDLAGESFNLNSPKQLGDILFGKMGLPVVQKTPSGAPSTGEEVLSKLAEDFPLPQVLLEYRGVAKLKSTYTDKLPRMINATTHRVHTHYAQAAVITGRLASSDPNLQNIPVRTQEGRRVRMAFVPDAGNVIVSADYSQIELRVMAEVSGDANLIAAFARGDDIHRATAAEVFGVAQTDVTSDQRRSAKAINFGLIYGMSAFGLASNLGITRDAAQMYIDRYFDRYPGVARYMNDTRASARELGYVETVFGRRLWLPEIRGGNGPRRQGAERAAINAPMQGTAADLIKKAMVATQQWLETEGLRSRLIMQVHDELVLETPRDELARVQESLPGLMCNVATLKVPLLAEVGVGENWEEAH